jgi:hypothetical protein
MFISARSLSFAEKTLPVKVPDVVSMTRSAEYSTLGAGSVAAA